MVMDTIQHNIILYGNTIMIMIYFYKTYVITFIFVDIYDKYFFTIE